MIFIVVESPTKAKAIGEYLKGEKEEYVVLSTYGHIRNLIDKSGSIDTANDYNYRWQTTAQWEKHKKEIIQNAKKANKIIVATDLDREGEGIAWHFIEMLKENKITAPTERIVFHSISKQAILEAIPHAKPLRHGLVESYLARIGLDYLFGFSVSPVLWHRTPCCKSAGRVQSVALRLIVEREAEIRKFKSEKYFTIHATFKESTQEALMIAFNNQEFENGQIFGQKIDTKTLDGTFKVASIKKQQTRQFAPPPFITSTLQQAASSKLNFSPALTMQLAQKLYEGFNINGKHVGLITYMRTDSTNIEPSAIANIRTMVQKKYGASYLPEKPNLHKSSTKNAQEAHEAIRPVDIALLPKELKLGDDKLQALYQLIWERAVASQMSAAQLETITVQINGAHTNKTTSIFELKATNTIFAGFKILMQDDEENTKAINFENIKENETLHCTDVFEREHETQPPRRFSEATLIQQLEKRGIGRPSTYAKIISVLYERDYAEKEKKIMSPTQKGWIVTAFLKSFFKDEVEYEFTAKLEEELDALNENNGNHIVILDKFWKHLSQQIKDVAEKSPLEISVNVQHQFGEYFLEDTKQCKCGSKMMLKISKFGAMLGCEKYPDCKEVVNIDSNATTKIDKPLNENIKLKNGPYGPYIEIKKDEQIKRVPVPKIWQNDLESLSEEKAEFLASLPKTVGVYNGEKMTVSIGRFGPFIKHGSMFVSIKDPMNITEQEAIDAIEKKAKREASEEPKKGRFAKKTSTAKRAK